MDFPSLVLRLFASGLCGCLIFAYKFSFSICVALWLATSGGSLSTNDLIMIVGSLLIGFVWYVLLGFIWNLILEKFFSHPPYFLIPSDEIEIGVKNYFLLLLSAIPIVAMYMKEQVFTVEWWRVWAVLLWNLETIDAIIQYSWIWFFTIIFISLVFCSKSPRKSK